MQIQCPGCQSTFETYRQGKQFCPHCGAQLDVPSPSEGPPQVVRPAPSNPPGGTQEQGQGSGPSAPPSGETPQQWGGPSAPPSGETPQQWGGPSAPPPGETRQQWGGPSAPSSPPPGTPGQGGQWGGPPTPPPPPGAPWEPGRWGESPNQPPLQPSPWERRDQLGFFNAIYQTWAASTLRPTQFFSSLAPGKLSDALIYAMIITTIGSLFAYAWSGLYEASFLAAFANAGLDPGLMGNSTAASWILGMFFVPIWAAIYVFIGGAILHLCCMIFGCADRGFETTLRTLCYSTGAMLFGLLPFCGFVAQVWGTVVTVIGIKHQQQTTTGRAVGAVLLPLIVILLCVCGVGALAVFGFAALSAGL